MTPNQLHILLRLFIVFSGLYLMIRGLYVTDPLLYCAGLGGLWLQGRFAG